MNKDEAEKRWIDYIKASTETINKHAEQWVEDEWSSENSGSLNII